MRTPPGTISIPFPLIWLAIIFFPGRVTLLAVWIHITLSSCLYLQYAWVSLDRPQPGFLDSFLSSLRVRPASGACSVEAWPLTESGRHFSDALNTDLSLLPSQYLAERFCDYSLTLSLMSDLWAPKQGFVPSPPFICLFASSEAQINLKLNILSINYLDSKCAIPHSPWPWTSYVAEDDLTLLILLYVATTPGFMWC